MVICAKFISQSTSISHEVKVTPQFCNSIGYRGWLPITTVS